MSTPSSSESQQQPGAAGDPQAAQHVEITAADLPLHCPMARTPVWSSHPRVYLDLDADGHAKCPYCSTRYTLTGGARPGGH